MAKPSNWNKLPEEEKKQIALSLLSSMRGQYIMSQALLKAIDKMREIKRPFREESNIQDMEILHEQVFPIYRKEIMEMTVKKFKQFVSKKKLKGVV